MLHDDTWQAIARGAANSAAHGDIESACDVLENAALMLEQPASEHPELTRDEDERVARQRTARELRAAVSALRTADEEVG